MNDHARPEQLRSYRQNRSRTGAADRDFLPAALEIIESPPSPIRIGLIYTLAALVTSALAWSYFGFLDVYAVAAGKIQPSGRAKVVQPAEPGKIVVIKVKNGDHVEAGEVLVELDRAEATATRIATLDALVSARAEIARRRAAIEVAESTVPKSITIKWSPEIPPEIRSREERVLAADVSQLDSSLGSLRAQKIQKEAERDKAAASIQTEIALVSTLAERTSMYERLFQKKVGSRLEVINALHDLLQAKTQLADFEGTLKGAVAALDVIAAEIQKAKKSFVSDNTQKLAEAEQKAAGLAQDLAKADSKLGRMTLTAPVAGAVQASTITTIGQVVGSGQELMHIVPEGASFEIEAYVLNRDAGFVSVGQDAIIKVDAFPFTRYGTISGKVSHVADDAIPGAEAQQMLRDPTQAPSGSLSLTSAAQKTQDLVYPVLVAPSESSMVVDGKPMALSAGMTVTVEIKTERRRVIDYVLSPLIDIGATAMRER